MQVNAAEMQSGSRLKARLATVESLDGRTLAARRVRELMRAYQRQLGHKPSAIEAAAIQRTAILQTIAEDVRVRALAGGPGAPTLEDVVRCDNAAARAQRALQELGKGARPLPTLQQIMGESA